MQPSEHFAETDPSSVATSARSQQSAPQVKPQMDPNRPILRSRTASADLVQEPIQSSTLGGGSGADAASHVIPTSATASPAEPAQEDAKITSSQNLPATQPQAAPQVQQQQQATPGNQSSQTDTPTASSEQNAAATTQPLANAPARPRTSRNRLSHQPRIQRSHLRKTPRPLRLRLHLRHSNRSSHRPRPGTSPARPIHPQRAAKRTPQQLPNSLLTRLPSPTDESEPAKPSTPGGGSVL